ncbi:MAG: ribose-5-phosphate isomerase RpiA [Tepidisphaeraceae bacterium]
MNPKERAAQAALQHVQSGMTLGLGTGSTAKIFIDLLGAKIASGELRDIRGVPTSVRSDEQARDLGIEIVDFSIVDTCDVTIDGADEVSPTLELIKGLGGAMLREKIVAQNSKKLIIIADESKAVPHLFAKCPLPVEVTRFSYQASERYLKSIGSVPTLRQDGTGKAYVTDNGNFIYDCKFNESFDPAAVELKLKSRAGIVATGLFIGIASLAIIASDSGVRLIER